MDDPFKAAVSTASVKPLRPDMYQRGDRAMKAQMTATFECGMYVLDEARRRATEGGFNAHFGFKQSRNARVGKVSFTRHQAFQSTNCDSLVYEATNALDALDETAASNPDTHASKRSA